VRHKGDQRPVEYFGQFHAKHLGHGCIDSGNTGACSFFVFLLCTRVTKNSSAGLRNGQDYQSECNYDLGSLRSIAG